MVSQKNCQPGDKASQRRKNAAVKVLVIEVAVVAVPVVPVLEGVPEPVSPLLLPTVTVVMVI